MVPSFPDASIPWSTRSRLRRCSAHRRFCSVCNRRAARLWSAAAAVLPVSPRRLRASRSARPAARPGFTLIDVELQVCDHRARLRLATFTSVTSFIGLQSTVTRPALTPWQCGHRFRSPVVPGVTARARTGGGCSERLDPGGTGLRRLSDQRHNDAAQRGLADRGGMSCNDQGRRTRRTGMIMLSGALALGSVRRRVRQRRQRGQRRHDRGRRARERPQQAARTRPVRPLEPPGRAASSSWASRPTRGSPWTPAKALCAISGHTVIRSIYDSLTIVDGRRHGRALPRRVGRRRTPTTRSGRSRPARVSRSTTARR